jgi:hypothetical protein
VAQYRVGADRCVMIGSPEVNDPDGRAEVIAMGCSGIEQSSVLVSFRSTDDLDDVTRQWGAVVAEEFAAAYPWRIFRWYLGQKHYSGTYWSSTVGGSVIYESRLELARLLFVDFEPAVRHIVAQPFLLRATVDQRSCKHIPDYFLMTDAGPVVMDVKPARRLADPKVAFTFAWTREVVEARGWRYEVATEPPAVELANVRFLSGYRRGWLFAADLLAQLRAYDLHGMTLDDAFNCVPTQPNELVRSAVLHLLWRQELRIELSKPLSRRTELRSRA